MNDKSSPATHHYPSRIASVSGVGENSWCIYADGFLRAAELLINNIKATYEINTVIFPILFLYRQYTELTLKEIIGYSQYLSEHRDVRQGGHDLKNLWCAAKSYIQRHYKETSNDELTQIQGIIQYLHKLDPTSQASRFPVISQKDSGGKRLASFAYNAEPIDIDELAAKMKVLASLFERITNFLSVCKDLRCEFYSKF